MEDKKARSTVETSNEKNIQNDIKANQLNNPKKSRARMYIVLLFILLVAIVGYVIYRGEYLEILEIGEQYLSIFWQNVNYTAITFGINFIVLFIACHSLNLYQQYL